MESACKLRGGEDRFPLALPDAWPGTGRERVMPGWARPRASRPRGRIISRECGCGWLRGNTFEVAELIMQKGFAIFSPGPEKAAHDALGGTERGQFTVKSQLQTPTSNRRSARTAKTRIYSVAYTTERAK